MLLRDDDPRAAILLAWLATRDLLDADAVPGGELDVREVRTPAEAQPWITKWDGLTADLAKDRAAAFLEELHEAPLLAVLRRTCGDERPALASIDEARFDAIGRAIDRAFRAAGKGERSLEVREVAPVVAERARPSLEALGFAWSSAEGAFVRASGELALRLELAGERRTRGETGLRVAAIASVRSPRVDRLRESLPREPAHVGPMLALPLLARRGAPVVVAHRGQLSTAADALTHELAALAPWAMTFDSAARVLDALTMPEGSMTPVPDTDAAWPERRALVALLHGLATIPQAIAGARASYARLGYPSKRRSHAEGELARLLERALTLDPPPLGPLAISAELASVLARAARGATPALRQSAIASAEGTLGAVVPDEVLAYVAAVGADAARVIATTREAREQEVARWGRAPLDELGLVVFDLQPASPFFAAAYRRRSSTRAHLDFCVYDLFHGYVVESAELTSLAAYLRWRYDARTTEDELAIDLEAPPPDAFVATVIGDEPRPREARVRHPKLGGGRVLERIGDKLVIAFDDGTQRTLLARFCEEE